MKQRYDPSNFFRMPRISGDWLLKLRSFGPGRLGIAQQAVAGECRTEAVSLGSRAADRVSAMAYRDGLVIALLALRPLRRKNLAGLVIDTHLQRAGDGWLLRLPPEDTKTRTPIECSWPDALVPALERYLAVYRPALVALRPHRAACIGHALWVSCQGSPMSQEALYGMICSRTRAGLGKPINPHLFRDCAATTIAIADPDHVRLAAPLLGHRSASTTERHYQQAQSLSAHRRYCDVIKRRTEH